MDSMKETDYLNRCKKLNIIYESCLSKFRIEGNFLSSINGIYKNIILMHETSARTWCTGKTQRDRVEREVGGGIGMGNTCISKADSCQCRTKTTTIL